MAEQGITFKDRMDAIKICNPHYWEKYEDGAVAKLASVQKYLYSQVELIYDLPS